MRILFLMAAFWCATPVSRANNDPASPAPCVQQTNTPLSPEVYVQMFLDHPTVMSFIGGN
jgi:hypothetical protein